jgi:hypothetical protein
VTTNTYYPSITGPSGLKIGGGGSSNQSLVVTQAPGKDVFYVETVTIVLTAHGVAQTTGRKQFYPYEDHPDGTFGRSGITKGQGGYPGASFDDFDNISLVKMAPQGLIDYLAGHDPTRYATIKMDALGTAVGEAGQRFANGALLLEGVLNLFSKSAAAETFYRTMSTDDFAVMQKTGKVPATSETFLSPTAAYSSNYQGVLVEINTKAGTLDKLKSIGVRDPAHPMTAGLNLPSIGKGWKANNAFFKQEAGQVNIGLGQGKALQTFNSNILNFKQIKKP